MRVRSWTTPNLDNQQKNGCAFGNGPLLRISLFFFILVVSMPPFTFYTSGFKRRCLLPLGPWICRTHPYFEKLCRWKSGWPMFPLAFAPSPHHWPPRFLCALEMDLSSWWLSFRTPPKEKSPFFILLDDHVLLLLFTPTSFSTLKAEVKRNETKQSIQCPHPRWSSTTPVVVSPFVQPSSSSPFSNMIMASYLLLRFHYQLTLWPSVTTRESWFLARPLGVGSILGESDQSVNQKRQTVLIPGKIQLAVAISSWSHVHATGQKMEGLDPFASLWLIPPVPSSISTMA